MLKLSNDLIQEILLYCNYNSKIQFCKVNRYLCNHFLKDYREITIEDPQEIRLWITELRFRRYVRKVLINDPYKHVSLNLSEPVTKREEEDLQVLVQDKGLCPDFQLKQLTITFGYFNRFIRQQMTKLHSIQLFIDSNHVVHQTSWDSDINDTLYYLSNNGPRLQLKEEIRNILFPAVDGDRSKDF
eukprot:gene11652-12713_t